MVEFRPPRAQALMWVDIETPGLPEGNDFSVIPPLEICVILTDFDLQPFAGYEAVFKPTPEHVAALRKNPDAAQMHRESGLLAALKGDDTVSVQQAEGDIIGMVKRAAAFDKGEYMIAGSGVASFDYPLLKHWMPNLCHYLAYFPFDIGVMRRTARVLSHNRTFVNPNAASYGDAKLHRARADVEAHIAEARQWMDWFRGLP